MPFTVALMLRAGRSLHETIEILAVIALAGACGIFFALHSRSLRRLDRVLWKQGDPNLRFA